MAPRIRPATTLAIILSIAFAFQLIAILTVPITKTLTLCTYDGYKFGVFGLCNGDKCSNVGIGYSGSEISDLSGFSLPSNARHSVSKLLIVHPIAAGFTFISLLASVLLHWHGPSNSLRFLFFLLLWTIPSFLMTLLSFLVDILLFVPHLDWGGWIVLAATVLIAISGVLLCIMRRTISSRRVLKRKDTFNNDYHMQPLNYGYGTVDANSDTKPGSSSYYGKDEADDERLPFVHESNETFDNSMNVTQTNEDLNNYPSTQLYDTMRGENRSAQSNSTGYRSPENILAPLSPAYRGGYDKATPNMDSTITPGAQPVPIETSAPSAPYPADLTDPALPSAEQNGSQLWNAPYPKDTNHDTTASYDRNSTPHVGSKPFGPRPMPFASSGVQEELPLLPSEMAAARAIDTDSPSAPPIPESNESDDEYDDAETTLPAYPHDENPHQLVQETKRLYESDPPTNGDNSTSDGVTREGTYRTRIANTIDQLQGPPVASNSTFFNTNDSLMSSHSQLNLAPAPVGIMEEDDDDDDDLYGAPKAKSVISEESEPKSPSAESFVDGASSSYSSRVPSVINTPIDPPKKGQSFLNPNRGAPTSNNNATTSSMAIDNIYDRYARDSSLSVAGKSKEQGESSDELYPFIDPLAKRLTPAPSFSNISITSSNFTSVSQRGINPKYLESNLEEKTVSPPRQDLLPNRQPPGTLQNKKSTSNTDLLISSNPDFSVLPLNKRNKRKSGRPNY